MAMVQTKRLSDKVFRFFNGLFLWCFAFVTLYPFWIVIINSFSTPNAVVGNMAVILPRKFSVINFVEVFKQNNILNPILISVSRTIVGTATGVMANTMLAYGLSRPKLPLGKLMYRIMVLSMYVSAGLIPAYVTLVNYGFKNTFWVYIIPGMVSAYNMILIKTYIESLPGEVEESALIDGAGYFTLFFRIILPMIVPILATIATFTAVGQWNSWADNLYYNPNTKLKTLQLFMLEFIQSKSRSVAEMQRLSSEQLKEELQVNATSIRMAVTVITVAPIMCVYPFAQKYFTKGIMLGAVKG